MAVASGRGGLGDGGSSVISEANIGGGFDNYGGGRGGCARWCELCYYWCTVVEGGDCNNGGGDYSTIVDRSHDKMEVGLSREYRLNGCKICDAALCGKRSS